MKLRKINKRPISVIPYNTLTRVTRKDGYENFKTREGHTVIFQSLHTVTNKSHPEEGGVLYV